MCGGTSPGGPTAATAPYRRGACKPMSETEIRAEFHGILIEHTRTRIEDCHCGGGVNTGALGQSHALHVAHHLRPVVRRAVEQARAEERERIAQALERVPDELYPVDVFGGPWDEATARQANELLRGAGLPVYDRVGAQIMRHAYRQMARMLREVGDPDA